MLNMKKVTSEADHAPSCFSLISALPSGLQLLTSTVAPIQAQRSTSFLTSYLGEEILNTLDPLNHCDVKPCVCEWGKWGFVQSDCRDFTELRMSVWWRFREETAEHQHQRKPQFGLQQRNPVYPRTYQNSGKPCRNSMRGFPRSPAAT